VTEAVRVFVNARIASQGRSRYPSRQVTSFQALARIEALRDAALVVYARPDAILADAPRAPLLASLSEDELDRHARFRFEHDRDAYLVAHALTRRLLGELAGVDAKALRFITTEHGRPELAAPSCALSLRFNLSHTRGLVACGVTRDTDIGVDTEHVDRNVQLLGVARHVFSEREIAGLESLSEAAQRSRFFDLWTLKEAYVKAIGKGLAAPLRAITFAPEQPDPVPVHFDSEAADDAGAWCFRRHTPSPSHRLAVALRAGPSAAISFREIAAAQLLGSLLE
jgi:4'-phosphopantetheinyl transferase